MPDRLDIDACTVFDLQQKHAFGLLVFNIKESSVLPIIRKYSDPNATNYGDAQLLYDDLVSHFTKGLSGCQRLEIIEREIDDLHLDSKWGKSCESFLNFIDNKLKDHQGIAPVPTQYPDSWYITRLNRTLESHTTLYQYIINHQMQADSIANHLGTTSATATSYESYVETIRTFCQTIDHVNRKAVHEKSRREALQTEYQQSGSGSGSRRGRGRGRDDKDDGRTGGRNSGRGRQGGRGRSGGRYHNWIPKEQFDCLDQAGYQQLIRDRVARGEVQANNTKTASLPPAASTTVDISTPISPALSVHIPPTDNPSVLTGSLTTSSPNPHNNAHSVSMAIVTPHPPIHGSTTSTQMDSGTNTLLRQLMSNASARTNPSSASNLQARRMNYIYRITHQEQVPGYMGALVDSGANGGMAGCDTRVLSMVPHAHVDITGVGGSVMERLPLVQCASGVDTIDEGRIVLIMSQYAHKPDSKTIHSKSQLEHFGSIVHDSAITAGGHQMVVTHEGYAIPLHVRNGLYYGHVPSHRH